MDRNKQAQHFSLRNWASQVGLMLALLGPAAILTSPIQISDLNDEVLASAQQSNGQNIIVGRFVPGKIMRLNADGTVDSSFYQSWMISGFNQDIHSVAVQVDDQIVVGGNFTSFDDALAGYLLRLRADGSLDTAFLNAMGTGFDGPVSAVALQPDGRILVGGSFLSFNGNSARYIARLNPDGSLDSSFVPDRSFDNPVLAIRSLPSGQIFVGGQFTSYRSVASPYLATLQRDGELENP